ncbi:hypothetical protein [Stigmatella erecta]|uniref:hypothetical protein n=1 Tax=Stigmatella erecta TaxID=83460 RepID=UPI0015A6F441|nr:hypothetical protein [Stigmatella erecta]
MRDKTRYGENGRYYEDAGLHGATLATAHRQGRGRLGGAQGGRHRQVNRIFP